MEDSPVISHESADLGESLIKPLFGSHIDLLGNRGGALENAKDGQSVRSDRVGMAHKKLLAFGIVFDPGASDDIHISEGLPAFLRQCADAFRSTPELGLLEMVFHCEIVGVCERGQLLLGVLAERRSWPKIWF